MATLFNTKIKDTYQSLLKLEDNTILTTTTKNVTDGLGNASPLYMSTTRIGVGTNNPTTTLDVNGSAKVSGAVSILNPNYMSLTSNYTLEVGYNVNGKIRIGYVPSVGSVIQGSGNGIADYLSLQYFGGNVGIGTVADAGYKLDVNGSVRLQNTLELGGNTTYTGNDYQFFIGGGSRIRFQSGGSMFYTGTGGSATITLRTSTTGSLAGTEFLGNNSPSVSSTVFKFNNSFSGNLGISTIHNFIELNPTGTVGQGSPTLRTLYINPSITGFTKHIAFENTTGDVLLGTTSGNVGIGTSSPGSKLTVDGNISVINNNSIIGYVAANQGMYLTGGAGEFRFINGSGAGWYYTWYQNNQIERMRLSTANNLLIGTDVDAGEKLQVNGTARVGSTLQLDNGAITWGNASGIPTSRLRITRRTGYGAPSGIEIGALNSNTSAFVSKPIVLGDMNTLADVGCLIVGLYNNIQKDQSVIVGNANSVPLVTGVNTHKQIILGDSNTANGYTNGQVPGIMVGNGNNQDSFAFTQMYGSSLKPYANGQLLFGANAGPVNPSIREVFIGYGYRNEFTTGNQDNGNGNNLLISPSNASDATDKNGGNLTLAGSRGTGAGTPGNLIFSTATATTTGTTLQTLSERMRITGTGNVGVGEASPTARLQVKGSGSTSATTSLLVQNSAGTAALTILDDRTANFSSQVQIQSTIFADSGQIFRNSGNLALQSVAGVGNNKSVVINASPNITEADVAILVCNSTTKGFLPPRMLQTQRTAIASPAVGLIVYQTDMVEGLYIYKSTGWTFII